MYKFYLCQTSDMTRLGEFTKASSRNLVVALNRSGSYSFNVKCEDPLYPYMVPKATCIEAEKDGKTIWSGPIEAITTNFPARTASVSCIGWFDLLKRRNVRDNGLLNYPIVNPGLEPSGAEYGWLAAVTAGGGWGGTSAVAHSGIWSRLISAPAFGDGFTMYQEIVNVPIGVLVTANVWLRLGTLGSAVANGTSELVFALTVPVLGATLTSSTLVVSTTWQLCTCSWFSTRSDFEIGLRLNNFNSAPVGFKQIAVDDFSLTYESLNFTNTDIGEIAMTLVDRVNEWDPCPVKRGFRQTSWPRTVRYVPFQNVGEEIQRMSDVENGYDFEVDPVSRQLNVYYPMKGSVKTSYDAPSVAYDRSGATQYWRFADVSTTSTPSNVGASNPITGTGYTSTTTLCSYDPGDAAKNKTMSVNTFGTITTPIVFGDGSYTLSMQFKLSTFVNVNQLSLVTIQDDASGVAGGTLILFADGSLKFLPGRNSGEYLLLPAGTLVAGTTYHVVATYDAATKLAVLYIDGVVKSTGTATINRQPGSQFLYIGQYDAGIGTPVLTMDEFAIWAGRTLSFSEVQYLYQSLRLRTAPGAAVEAVRFGYGARGAQNVVGVNKILDSRDMANWVVTQGKGSSGGSGALARNPASIAYYGAHDEVNQVSQIDSIQLLASYANAEVAVRGVPRLLYEFQPLTWTPDNSVPSAFFDYDIGDVVNFDALDTVTLTDDAGNSQVVTVLDVADQNVRIFGISVTLDEQGTEKITLATSPGS